MINADMRNYDYYIYGEDDLYGQAQLSAKKGVIKMAINVSTKSNEDSIMYSNAEFIGLTHADITDKYVIQYGNCKLKVLYINPKGRYTQVTMARM